MRACRCGRLLLLVAFVWVMAAPAHAQAFYWWKCERSQRELGLTTDQSARIERVFEAALPQLRQTKAELDRQELELSRLIQINADEAQVLRQLDAVETTRGSLNKNRTLMLLHMRQVLTPDQRARLKAIQDQRQRDRAASPTGASPQC